MRIRRPLALALLLAFGWSSPSQACRWVLPGATAKTISANFAYFDHVATLKAVEVATGELVNASPARQTDYHLFEVLKEYKGDLPDRFINTVSHGNPCGYFVNEGDIILAFFDARETAVRVSPNDRIPVLATDLDGRSKIIRLENVSVGDAMLTAAGVPVVD